LVDGVVVLDDEDLRGCDIDSGDLFYSRSQRTKGGEWPLSQPNREELYEDMKRDDSTNQSTHVPMSSQSRQDTRWLVVWSLLYWHWWLEGLWVGTPEREALEALNRHHTLLAPL
jgi:hypothetical protein